MSYRGRCLVRLTWFSIVSSILLTIGCLLIVPVLGSTSSEFQQGSSLYGDASVSWLPPGRTCTWVGLAGEHVDRPDLSRLLVVALAIFCAPIASYLERLVVPVDESPEL